MFARKQSNLLRLLATSCFTAGFFWLAQPAGAVAGQNGPAPVPLQDTAAPQAREPAVGPNTAAMPSFGSYLSGRFAESQGDTTHGIGFLRESLKANPNNKETIASLYRMLILSGNIEEAIPLSSRLNGVKVVDDGSEFSPDMLLALQEGKQGHYAEATRRLDAIPKAGFNNLLVPLLQAWLSYGQGALKAPIDAKTVMPNTRLVLPQAYLNAGLINDLAGFDDEALKDYRTAVADVRIEPFRAVEALANYDARKHDASDQRKLVESYVAAHGDSYLIDALLAPSSEKTPARLVNNPTEGLAEALYTMASIFHGVRAPSDEIAILHLALYLRSDFPAAQFLLANAYELTQEYRSAIAAYGNIDHTSPYYLRGRIRAAYDKSELGMKDEALADLEHVAGDMPRATDPLLAEGDILRSQQRCKEAVAVYDRALTRAGTPGKQDWPLFFARGGCFDQLGQSDRMEADMKKALSLSPDEPDVLNYLGYSYLLMHRNLPQARKMIETAYDARPEDVHIIDSMGYALYTSGDFASAEEYFEQALERTPNDPTVNDHLGDTYWQLGRKTEARYQWQRALEDSPDDELKRDLQRKLDKGLKTFHVSAAITAPADQSVLNEE